MALLSCCVSPISTNALMGKSAMAIVNSNGIEIEVAEFGSSADPAILLIAGWSVQLTFWLAAFIENLVSAEYRVIAFDYRDAGLSTKVRHFPATSPLAPHILAARVLRRK
jgi:pimeloyl-ACP methyl ester carboxylesterase